MAESDIGQASDPPVRGDAIQAVQALLDKAAIEQPPAEAEAPETDAVADPPPAETWELKAVAEKLGADPAKLYENLKVALGDGEEMTVSALKDAYLPVAEVEKARKAFAEEQTRWRTDQETATRELHALLSTLPPQALTPQFLQEAQRQTEAARQKSVQQLLEAIPEWKDPVTKAADWSDLKGTAKTYGFTDADIALAEQGFADARFLKMARDLTRLQAKAKAEAEKPKPKTGIAPQGQKTQSEGQRIGAIKGAVRTGRMSPVAAVEKLLGAASAPVQQGPPRLRSR